MQYLSRSLFDPLNTMKYIVPIIFYGKFHQIKKKKKDNCWNIEI